MIEYYIYRFYPWAIVSILLIAFALIRWLYYRKFKTGRIKRGDIITNLSDGTKSTVLKTLSKGQLMTKTKLVRLPETFSDKEMIFIEEWYSEAGMQQLLWSKNKPCSTLDQKPPTKECKYVKVKKIPVIVYGRNNQNLHQTQRTELKDVTLLLLNEWIK